MTSASTALLAVAVFMQPSHIRRQLGRVVSSPLVEGTFVLLLASSVGLAGCVGGLVGPAEDETASEKLSTSVPGEPAPEVDRPNFYDRDNIAFMYPGNWSVSVDVTEWSSRAREPEHRRLVLESPVSAFVTIQRFSPSVDVSAEEFSERMLENTEKEAKLPVGTSTHVQTFLAGRLRDGVETSYFKLAHGVSVSFVARTFRVEKADSVTFLFVHANEETWMIVDPGFSLIIDSLALE